MITGIIVLFGSAHVILLTFIGHMLDEVEVKCVFFESCDQCYRQLYLYFSVSSVNLGLQFYSCTNVYLIHCSFAFI